jgi:hypothetical protein
MENVGSVVTGRCGRKREMRCGARGESESAASADAAPGSMRLRRTNITKGATTSQIVKYYFVS